MTQVWQVYPPLDHPVAVVDLFPKNESVDVANPPSKDELMESLAEGKVIRVHPDGRRCHYFDILVTTIEREDVSKNIWQIKGFLTEWVLVEFLGRSSNPDLWSCGTFTGFLNTDIKSIRLELAHYVGDDFRTKRKMLKKH